ncbi:MAG: hypothetical protein LBT47_07460 [Deltaproteobacteria bacterium]|nr:hypothetical protein [Deltaproteobacteria bacterium]
MWSKGNNLRLFALNIEQSKHIRRFLRWHLGYLAVVALFFSWMYMTGRFRSSFFWRERFLFLVLAPLVTAVFVAVGPWRRKWLAALKDMYTRLEGQTVFCVMAGFVFLFGFFIYTLLIWGLATLVPALVHM